MCVHTKSIALELKVWVWRRGSEPWEPVYHHAESQTCGSGSFLPKSGMLLQAELQTSQTI